jgi:hypothetical protein
MRLLEEQELLDAARVDGGPATTQTPIQSATASVGEAPVQSATPSVGEANQTPIESATGAVTPSRPTAPSHGGECG